MGGEAVAQCRLEADIIQLAQDWATLRSDPGQASRGLMVAEARLAGAVAAMHAYQSNLRARPATPRS